MIPVSLFLCALTACRPPARALVCLCPPLARFGRHMTIQFAFFPPTSTINPSNYPRSVALTATLFVRSASIQSP